MSRQHPHHMKALLALGLALVLALGLTAGAQAASNGGGLVRLIVHTDHELNAAARSQLEQLGAEVFELEFTPDTMVVIVPTRAEASVAGVQGVLAVERDQLLHAFAKPPTAFAKPSKGGGTQPPQETPWGVAKIQAPDAWTTSTGSGVKVCVADTGADKDHPDLAGNIVAGRNFTGGGPFANKVDPNKWQDGNSHGTHVAGTVAALNNTIGVVGVAHGAPLLIAKVLDDSGSGWISWIVDGLNWCGSQGAQVTNMSFGGGASATLQSAIQGLATQNIVQVAASGNSGASSPSYPAAYAEVIAVGATDSNDSIASFSNRGEEVNAPGVDVKSTVPDDSYGLKTGTSMASPHGAGTAALVIGAGVTDAAQVRQILSDTADAITDGVRINAKKAVDAAVAALAPAA